MLIYIYCHSDVDEIKKACDIFKNAHPNEYDEVFIKNIIKRRKDLDHIGEVDTTLGGQSAS